MRPKLLLTTLLLSCLFATPAQTARKPVSHNDLAERSGYQLSGSGPNHSKYTRITAATNAATGKISIRTNSFVMLSAGRNRWDGRTWVEAEPKLVITNNFILGQGAEHEARFAANVNTLGATQIRIGGTKNQWLKTHVLGIAFETAETNVLVATLQDSTAQVAANDPRTVLYTNAFLGRGVSADLRYSFSASGVSQDVVIHSLPSLRQAGIFASPDSVKVVLMTELVDSAAPRVQQRVWTTGKSTFRDQQLDFGGSMRMSAGRSFRVGASRSEGIPTEKRHEVIEGRSLILEFLPYPRVARELKKARAAGLTSLNDAEGSLTPRLVEGSPSVHPLLAASPARTERAGVREAVEWGPDAILHPLLGERAGVRGNSAFRLTLPPRPPPPSVFTQPIKRVARLAIGYGFVADWDFIEYGGDWDAGVDCTTFVIEGEYHLNSAIFRPGVTVKQDPGSSLWVDGPFYWDGDSYCPTAPAVITSVSDEAHGESIPWSCGTPAQGEYGPALAVSADDLATALTYVTAYYAQPGIIANPVAVPTVTAAASDSKATKGTVDYGTFTLTRSGWDDSDPLTVSFSVSGTAAAGTDYISLGTAATIPASEDSVVITNVPLTQSGATYRSSVILSLQPSNTYMLGSPSVAQGSLYDPSAPDPTPVGTPSGLVAWWRGETNALDSVGTNHGTLTAGAGYGSGKVGLAFNLTNAYTGVGLGHPDDLLLQDFTIETWAQRANPDYVSYDPDVDSLFLSCGWAGWGFGLSANGRPLLSQIGANSLNPNISITDTNWHHLAMTKTETVVIFYVDGVAYPGSCYGSTFWVGSDMALGACGDDVYNNSFNGKLDELAFYDHALTGAEIQAICAADKTGKGADDLDGNGVLDIAEDANHNGIPDWLEVVMGFNPSQTNGLGTTKAGYGLFMAQPRSNSLLP